jgi:hypothetical protein
MPFIQLLDEPKKLPTVLIKQENIFVMGISQYEPVQGRNVLQNYWLFSYNDVLKRGLYY